MLLHFRRLFSRRLVHRNSHESFLNLVYARQRERRLCPAPLGSFYRGRPKRYQLSALLYRYSTGTVRSSAEQASLRPSSGTATIVRRASQAPRRRFAGCNSQRRGRLQDRRPEHQRHERLLGLTQLKRLSGVRQAMFRQRLRKEVPEKRRHTNWSSPQRRASRRRRSRMHASSQPVDSSMQSRSRWQRQSRKHCSVMKGG